MKRRIKFSNLQRKLSLTLALACLLATASGFARAQAEPTAIGTGSRWLIGGTYAYFQADYGKRYLGGGSGFVDYARSPRISYEAEVRFLTMNEEFGTHQSTYLIGAKFPYYKRWATPYAKILVGEGRFHFPYGYADGSYFVLAPGAGVDLPIGRSRISVRLIDVEYQSWVNFPFGTLNPYGISTGVALRIH
jgi:hypothetical protein